ADHRIALYAGPIGLAPWGDNCTIVRAQRGWMESCTNRDRATAQCFYKAAHRRPTSASAVESAGTPAPIYVAVRGVHGDTRFGVISNNAGRATPDRQQGSENHSDHRRDR